MQAPWAIGLATGTVLDGNIDIAAIRTDGVEVAEFRSWTLAPYAGEVRDLVAQVMEAARDGIAADEVAAVGLHGQTPERRGDTRQLGDGAR